MLAKNKPFVSIVMPALNEERYISVAIASIIPRSDEVEYELLVVDGGSTDRTRAIVESLAASNPRIRVIANEKKIQSAGVNMGAKMSDASSNYIVRADCHLHYPDGFVERCLRRFSDPDVASVVVPMRTEGTTCMQKAIAAAQNSRLGNGGSAHRLPGRSGFVDHGHHAAFDRQTFLKLGGYDESFSHNEDAEFDKRVIKSGKRIYLDSEAAITYYPRTTLGSLSRQYFRHGWGRASTLLKHRTRPQMRQMLPPIVLLTCLIALVLAPLNAASLMVPAAYAAASMMWGIGLAVRKRELCLALSGIAAMVMHMSWAAGFLLNLGRPSNFAFLLPRLA